MTFCQNCGRILAENETCNCTVNTETVPQPVDIDVQEQPKKKSHKNPIIKLILILIVLILLLSCMFFSVLALNYFGGHVTKSSNMNGIAGSLFKYTNSAFTILDEEGYYVGGGCYILSSDDGKNYNVPENFDEDMFYDIVDEYYEDSDKYAWFAVVENCDVTYIAVSKSWNSDMVGTYPLIASKDASHYDVSYYSNNSESEKVPFTIFYNDALEKVKQKVENDIPQSD